MQSLIEDPLIQGAIDLVASFHSGQKRKYTGFPYATHCEQVAAWVALAGGTPAMIAAAWLHDVLEDTGCVPYDISRWCNAEVWRLVEELTDASRPEDGNRAERKRIDRERLAAASPEAQTIKLADLIDNTLSIAVYDPSFARVYLDEKRELLKVLTRGDDWLWVAAFGVLQRAEALLVRHQLAENESR